MGTNVKRKLLVHLMHFNFIKTYVVHHSLTGGQAVEANSDRGVLHWVATVQTAQHRLNRVAFGLLDVDNDLLFQLHRFKLQATFWNIKVLLSSA